MRDPSIFIWACDSDKTHEITLGAVVAFDIKAAWQVVCKSEEYLKSAELESCYQSCGDDYDGVMLDRATGEKWVFNVYDAIRCNNEQDIHGASSGHRANNYVVYASSVDLLEDNTRDLIGPDLARGRNVTEAFSHFLHQKKLTPINECKSNVMAPVCGAIDCLAVDEEDDSSKYKVKIVPLRVDEVERFDVETWDWLG